MKVILSVPRIHTNYTGMVEGLINEGHDVVFLTMNGDEIYIPFDLDVGVHHFKPRGRFFFPKNRTKLLHYEKFGDLKRVLVKEKPDLLIIRDLKVFSIQVGLIAKILNIPVLFYDQTSPIRHKSLKRRLWYFIVRSFISKYRITTVTNYKISKNDSPKNTFFIPFSVPETPVKTKYESAFSPSNPLKIMVVSKLGEKRKNLLFLLESLLPFFKDGRVRLSIYGMLKGKESSQYTYRQLMTFIEINNLSSMIDIYPNEVYERVLNAYSEHDLFILPSLNEPAAISPFEAMSSGIPVIVTEQNGTNYIIDEEKNGFIFNPKNTNDLQEKVKLYLDNPDLIEDMGKQALASINDNYRPIHFSENLLSIASTISNSLTRE